MRKCYSRYGKSLVSHQLFGKTVACFVDICNFKVTRKEAEDQILQRHQFRLQVQNRRLRFPDLTRVHWQPWTMKDFSIYVSKHTISKEVI